MAVVFVSFAVSYMLLFHHRDSFLLQNEILKFIGWTPTFSCLLPLLFSLRFTKTHFTHKAVRDLLYLPTNFIHIHTLLSFGATKNDDGLVWGFRVSINRLFTSSQTSLCLPSIMLLIFQGISHFHLETERESITDFSKIASTLTPQMYTYTHIHKCMHTHLYTHKFTCNLKGKSSWLHQLCATKTSHSCHFLLTFFLKNVF